jgi:tRNA 2-thiouridine synthesizing protein E
MPTISLQNRDYKVDSGGYLMNPYDWDENFATAMAEKLGITGGLTTEHWKIINYIRNSFVQSNNCPILFKICRDNDIDLKKFKAMFPTGNQRGACVLAGVSFRSGILQGSDKPISEDELNRKSYTINTWGYLIDSAEWDELFAINKAQEMNMPVLSDRHWKIIYQLRESYQKTKTIPNIFELCEELSLNLKELEYLFPAGYHRGLIKLAGLMLK